MFSRVFNEPITLGLLSYAAEYSQSQYGFHEPREEDRRYHANSITDWKEGLYSPPALLN